MEYFFWTVRIVIMMESNNVGYFGEYLIWRVTSYRPLNGLCWIIELTIDLFRYKTYLKQGTHYRDFLTHHSILCRKEI